MDVVNYKQLATLGLKSYNVGDFFSSLNVKNIVALLLSNEERYS